jgi:hypothetical protein
MTLAALKRPAARASRIPRLTPGDSAKSSAQRQNEKDAVSVPMTINRPCNRKRSGISMRNSLLRAIAVGNLAKARE